MGRPLATLRALAMWSLKFWAELGRELYLGGVVSRNVGGDGGNAKGRVEGRTSGC